MTCHDHPNVKMMKIKRGLKACPVCGRVRVSGKKMTKLQEKRQKQVAKGL